MSVSGGKDSAVAAWILAKHAKDLGIDVALLHMYQGIPNYSDRIKKLVVQLAETLDIPLYIHNWEEEFGTGLPGIVGHMRKASCYICGTLKRYYQNILPKRMGYNVVATGHNLDDTVGFIVNNIITGQLSQIPRLSPVLPETELTPRKIKPLFWIQGNEALRYAEENGIPYALCQCPFQQLAPTFRIRQAFDDIEKMRPGAKKSFVKNAMRLAEGRKNINEGTPNKCRYCGAPTSGNVCAVCKIKMKMGLKPGNIVLPERVV